MKSRIIIIVLLLALLIAGGQLYIKAYAAVFIKTVL